MKYSSNTPLKLMCLALLLNCLPIFGQEYQADLSVRVTSVEFFDGIEPGESGEMRFHVTNHGPDPITDPDTEVLVYPGYNVYQDSGLFYDLIHNDPLEAHCSFHFINASPRPPIDDILYFHRYSLTGPLAVGETVTCSIPVTFSQGGYLETVWRVGYHSFDPNDTNNYDPFLFRGQLPAVPIHIGFLLSLLMGLIGIWMLFKTRQTR